MKVVIVGGSAAGAFAALLLARAGHRVLVVDRDRLEPAPDVEAAAAAAFRASAPQIVQRAAAQFDPTAFRAFWAVMGMMRRPGEVYTDPEVVARTRDAIRRHGSGPSMPQPTREQLLTALAAEAAG